QPDGSPRVLVCVHILPSKSFIAPDHTLDAALQQGLPCGEAIEISGYVGDTPLTESNELFEHLRQRAFRNVSLEILIRHPHLVRYSPGNRCVTLRILL